MGLNSSLSSPTSEQVCKKRGGGEASRFGPVNRSLLTDHSLKGLDNLRSTQALIKRPARDACLCMGELLAPPAPAAPPAPPAPPAPHFVFLITL